MRWCGVARRLMLQASDCALDAEDFGLVGLLLGQQRRPVGGSDPVAFDDLLVPATPSVPGALLRQLHFDTQTLLPYAAEYLLGWPAEVYRIPVAEASLAARELALAVHREEAAQVAHTDVEDFAIERVELSIASYKLVLLPLWIVGYRYDGYSYPLLVNGQTGTAAGEAPRGALGTALAALAGAGD